MGTALLLATPVMAFLLVSWLILLKRNTIAGTAICLALVVLVFVPPAELSFLPAGSLAPAGFATVLLLTAAWKRRDAIRIPRLFPAALVFYVLMMISTLLVVGEIDPFYSLLGVVGLSVLLLVANTTAQEDLQVRRTIVWTGIIQGAIALYEAVSGNGPILGDKITMTVENPFIPGLDRVQGTLGHPLALSVVLLVSLAIVLTTPTKPVRRFLTSALLLFAVVLTGSSSSAVVGVALIFWAVLSGTRIAGRVFVVLLSILGVLLVSNSEWGLRVALESDLSGRNVSHRMNSINAIPNLLSEQGLYQAIFGNGQGNTEWLYTQGILSNDGFHVIDNQWVTALVQTGVIGFIAFATFAIGAFIKGDRSIRAALIVFALMSISFDFLSWYPMTVLFFVLVGLAVNEKVDIPILAGAKQARTPKPANLPAWATRGKPLQQPSLSRQRPLVEVAPNRPQEV